MSKSYAEQLAPVIKSLQWHPLVKYIEGRQASIIENLLTCDNEQERISLQAKHRELQMILDQKANLEAISKHK